MKHELTHHYELKISNISCASCVRTIEQTLNAIPGVKKASVNFATKVAVIDSTTTVAQLIAALSKVGYEAVQVEMGAPSGAEAEFIAYQRFKREAYVAGLLGAILMVLGMTDWLPSVMFPLGRTIWIGLGLLTLIVLIFTAGDIYKAAFRSFLAHRANMDTLIAMGTGIAWLFSMAVTLFPGLLPPGTHGIYFESALIIIAFIKFGTALEMKTRGNTKASIQKLIDLQPQMASVIRDNQEKMIPLDEVVQGDLIRVRPGERVPLDGKIVEGHTTIDQAMLTGEPMPVEKTVDDVVVGGTLNQAGTFIFRAEQIGKDTVLAKIIEMVNQAQNTKPQIAQLADTISAYFVPAVIIIAIMTATLWFDLGPEPKFAYMCVTAATVLLIACPCALGLAAPLAIIAGVGRASDAGILIRKGDALQKMRDLTMVVFDKTGTITAGKPSVVKVVALENENNLLQIAASLEQGSEHPLADAILKEARARNLILKPIEQFYADTGFGVSAHIEGKKYLLGNAAFMKQNQIDLNPILNHVDDAAGQTIVYAANPHQLLGMIALSDTIKADAKDAIKQLKALGLKTLMLSGDQEKAAQFVARAVGIDQVIAGVLPTDKADHIASLQKRGEIVAMVGDGINDAPALAKADVGIALGAGTDIAIESADLILMSEALQGVPNAIRISKATVRNIKQNLFGAFIYNLLGIPIAAGVLYPLTGLLLNPMLAGIAMALSSLTVVLNANRLRFFKFNAESK